MLVLDTDILTFLQYGQGTEYERIQARIDSSSDTIYTTIVNLEEQLRGWIERCARAHTPEKYIAVTKRLRGLFEYYVKHPMLDFDENAGTRFTELKRAKVRIGTMDLRIAAIALANDAMLITRNLVDFRKVPGLRAEDWAAA